jgi:hypothetical protein
MKPGQNIKKDVVSNIRGTVQADVGQLHLRLENVNFSELVP